MTSVLVVEDDQTFRSSLGRDLSLRGLEVKLAMGAEEAIGYLSGARFDVLLTDLRLGGRDGIDLLKRARAIAPQTRTILMSGFATARDYQRAIELGAVRVLCKPFTSAELMQAIEHARDCSSGYSGSVHGLSLIDVLQLYQFSRRSLVLKVVGARGGTIILRDGAFVHAQYGDLVGETALCAMLAAPNGQLRTETLPAEYPCTIDRAPQEVLLDCLRRVDEGELAPELSSCDEPDVADMSRARIRQYWQQLLGSSGSIPPSTDVIGVDIATSVSVRIAGQGDSEAWGELLQDILESLQQLGGCERGVFDGRRGGVQIGAIWDRAQRVAFLLTDIASDATTSAWFRACGHAIARSLFDSATTRST